MDPLKDINASVVAIENGLASPQQIASQTGRDIEEVINDLAAFQALLAAKGVTLTGTTAATAAMATAASADETTPSKPAAKN